MFLTYKNGCGNVSLTLIFVCLVILSGIKAEANQNAELTESSMQKGFKMHKEARLALVTAAILLLNTPCPVAGGPCDCSTCQSYSDQKSRCLCCVYHGVGGKRAAMAARPNFYPPANSLSPTVHFFLSSGLAKDRTGLPKDGATGISRRWVPAGEAMTSHRELERGDTNMVGEAEFGLEPVLAVKPSRGAKDALARSATFTGLRQLMLGSRLGEISDEQ